MERKSSNMKTKERGEDKVWMVELRKRRKSEG